MFVHNAPTSFVMLDREMLATFSDVKEFDLYQRPTSPAAVWNAVRNCDVVFGWFASRHTLLPVLFARLLGRPSVIVIGGYDIACMPEIGYGHQRGGPARWISRTVIALATRLVTNSCYSRDEAARNVGVRPERIEMIYHGIPDHFGGPARIFREQVALTVGHGSRSNLSRKGLEAFVRAAALMPDIKFVVVGRRVDDGFEYLQSIATPNVTITGVIDDAKLNNWYRKASVYVQASLHEGFGMSLAEAMLAGCIPVVTREGAIPEVVGDTAVFVASHDPGGLAAAIRLALNKPDEFRLEARERIATYFPLSRRREALERLVHLLVPRETDSGS